MGHWIVLFSLGLILFEIRISTEKRLLLKAFPDDYSRYRKQVPQLVPAFSSFDT